MYNQLNQPGNSLGFKHSDKTKSFLSESRKGSLNPMYGKKKSDAFLAIHTGISVYVYDANMTFIKDFPGLRPASREVGFDPKTIKSHMDTHKIYKGYYFFSKKQ